MGIRQFSFIFALVFVCLSFWKIDSALGQDTINIKKDSVGRSSDSLQYLQYRRYAGYIGIGFPLGLGAEFTYRPLNSIAFSLGANLSLPILYLIEKRPSFSMTLSFETQKIKSEGYQNGVSASMIILQTVGFDPTVYTLAFCYGSMEGSLPVFNWKFGAMIFLRDHATTFLRRIEGLPILSISWRIF
jgi:hypothetical protein